MTTSGGGTGTPISVVMPPAGVYDQYEELVAWPNCAVPLHRYAKLIGYDEAAFWGVVYEDQPLTGCDDMWSEFERLSIAQALAEAQQEIETVIGYPLCPTWVAGSVEDAGFDPRWVDAQLLTRNGRLTTRYPRLLQTGVRATATIMAGATVNHTTDPATVGPIATTVTDADEVRIYYAGSERRVYPASVTIASGFLTVTIPRVRLVRGDLLNNPAQGLEYDVTNNFVGTVDVKREYNDPSTNAILVRPNCTNNNCSGGCGDCRQTACIYIRDAATGIVDVRPATWDATAGAWSNVTPTVCGPWAIVRLNYQSGLHDLSLQAEQAIVRLAHAKMPQAPCSCSKTDHLWQRDRRVPDVLTRERINCPFGLEAGAWTAYRFARAMAAERASVL